MNQELYAIRGEYVTLEKEKIGLEQQIRSLANVIEENISPLRKPYGEPQYSLSQAEHVSLAAENLKPLLKRHEELTIRLKELKPLAGL